LTAAAARLLRRWSTSCHLESLPDSQSRRTFFGTRW
jgi:hypothetical protein